MAAAMNAQDPLLLDGRVISLSGRGGNLGREVAIDPGNAGVILVLDGRKCGSIRRPGPILASRIEPWHGRGVDGGRRMDGLVG